MEWNIKPVTENTGDENNLNGVLVFNQEPLKEKNYLKIGMDIMTFKYYIMYSNH